MKRLFYAFRGVSVVIPEIGLYDLIQESGDIVVGKRTSSDILSNDVPENITKRHLRLIEKHDVKILNMLRDGRDVIESRMFATPKRWVASMRDYVKYRDYVDYTCFYERLVDHPNIIQAEISSKFGLVPIHPFKSYPSFVPDEAFNDGQMAVYPSRPIYTDGVRKDYNWRRLVHDTKEFCKYIDIFQELLQEAVS